WIDTPLPSQLVEITGISVQRITCRSRIAPLIILHLGIILRIACVARNLGNTVGDIVDHINPSNVLLFEQEHRLAFLLAENGDQHISARNLALARALHVENSSLQN